MPNKPARFPLWKIKRELNRVKTDLIIKHWPLRGALARMRYDAKRETAVRVTEGAQAPAAEYAVYLIYQPDGVTESVFYTLSWFIENGIAPVVVSNLALSADDRARLAGLSHLVIERPNIGYDFGGYREGILTVLERAKTLKALYVLNDSIWVPLNKDSGIIEKCRQAPEDIFGLHLSFLSRSNKWNEHIQSYFFRFNEELVNDPSFSRYWKKLPLMNHKRAVVQFCERAMCWHFADRGFTFDGLVNWKAPIAWLLETNDEEKMMKALRYQCRISPKEADILSPLLATGRTALSIRDELKERIEKRKMFATLISLHPQILFDIGAPFLKRTRTADLVEQRKEILELDLTGHVDPVIVEEIRIRDL